MFIYCTIHFDSETKGADQLRGQHTAVLARLSKSVDSQAFTPAGLRGCFQSQPHLSISNGFVSSKIMINAMILIL